MTDGATALSAPVPQGAAFTKAVAEGEPILQIRELVKHFPLTQGVLVKKQIGAVKAVDGVSFDLRKGRPWASSASPAAASRRWPRC